MCLLQELMTDASCRDVNSRCGLDSRNLITRTQPCQFDKDFCSRVHSCNGQHITILFIKALDICLPATTADAGAFDTWNAAEGCGNEAPSRSNTSPMARRYAPTNDFTLGLRGARLVNLGRDHTPGTAALFSSAGAPSWAF